MSTVEEATRAWQTAHEEIRRATERYLQARDRLRDAQDRLDAAALELTEAKTRESVMQG